MRVSGGAGGHIVLWNHLLRQPHIPFEFFNIQYIRTEIEKMKELLIQYLLESLLDVFNKIEVWRVYGPFNRLDSPSLYYKGTRQMYPGFPEGGQARQQRGRQSVEALSRHMRSDLEYRGTRYIG